MGDFTRAYPNVNQTVLSDRHWAAGALAGLVAGIAMSMVTMGTTAAMGQGVWGPVEAMAATVFGVDALVGGAMYDRVPAKALAIGMAYGLMIWALMTFVVLPAVNPTMHARVAMMPGSWLLEHLIYGGMLFLTPVLARHRESALPRTT